MKPDAQRIAIAEACGYKRGTLQPEFAIMPDYLNDLNAMHEAEKVLTDEQKDKYTTVLHEAVGNSPFWWAIAHATAAQRCEAFLRTIGKWTE